ncbi:MAG: hypothetical protein HQK52_18475 [Oligoflexia bacterium]|nr:hypothetical protein [Oligoflexia bacterium]
MIGPVAITAATINTGKVVGPFEAKDLKVDGELTVVGPVNCNDCKFTSPIEIVSKKSVFEDSELHKIVIRKDGDKKKQYLYLKGKTVVHGDIIFEYADAEVVVDKEAKVEGKIIKSGL